MSKFSSFWKNSTMLTKILLAALLVGVVIGGYKLLRSQGVISDTDVAVTTAGGTKIERDSNADLVIAYNTFPGVEGLVYMNGGMNPSEDSRIYKKYGIKVQIKQMDVVSDTRDGMKTGALDAAYCTIDALSTEMGSGSALLDLGIKNYLKINESRGADAIVVTPGINTTADLKGKKIAYAIGTASNTLLLNILETTGLTVNDIQGFKVSDGVEAANAFKSGQVDAAVVWAPDDEDCVQAVKGAKVLISTSTATQIIADGLLIKEATYEKKKELFVKLAKAWLEGNGELNDNPNAKKEANKLFAKGFDFPEDVAAASANKIRFSTALDNEAFYGLNSTYTGVTGEKMYSRMAVKYTEAGLADSPAPWRKVSSDALVEEITKDNAFMALGTQKAEGQVKFTAPTKEQETVTAQSSKPVSLSFATASYQLDEAAKSKIDREVSQIAQAFAGARIRVEGNTDNTGNPTSNKALSKKRAEAVVNYLVNEYKFDRNKFIVVGNGSDKPVADNSSEEGKAANRRTEFQFIW